MAEEPDAEALFKEGLEAMRAGNYEVACPKIRESHRLDPLPGALFTLAECEAAAGRSATSIQLYQEFVNSLTSLPSDRRDQFDERKRMALDKITALSALAPEITVDVASGAPSDLVVKRNEVVIEPSAYGVGKKVDQGEYVVSAELEGKPVWERRFKLQERDRARIEVPWPLPKKGSAAEEAPVKITPAPAPVKAQSKPLPKMWMYVSGGVGAAGLATGIVAGLIAMGKRETSRTTALTGSATPSAGTPWTPDRAPPWSARSVSRSGLPARAPRWRCFYCRAPMRPRMWKPRQVGVGSVPPSSHRHAAARWA